MLSRHFAVPAEELEVRLPVGRIGRCRDDRPQPRDVSLEAENGRGLLLVETLAAVWGSAPDPAGKVVRFEVGPPDAHTPAPDRQPANQVSAGPPFRSPADCLSRSAVGVPAVVGQ